MANTNFKSIPDGFIEEADEYIIKPIHPNTRSYEIGGKLWMNQIVIEQMRIDKIIATTGTEDVPGKPKTMKSVCIIIVDYFPFEIEAMIDKAQKKLGKVIDDLAEMN